MLKITKKIYDGFDLREVFAEYGRLNQFSYEGYQKLYELLDTREDLEIDIIEIFCDFSEDYLSNVLKNYGLKSFEDLHSNTLATMVDDETVIYQVY